jgi:hypothetical protein
MVGGSLVAGEEGMNKLQRFYDYLHTKPCSICRHWPVEAHHISAVVSDKTGLPLPRSHKADSPAAFCAIPLCPECHRTGKHSIHALGEDKFFQHHGKPKGYKAGLVIKYLVELYRRAA